MVTILVAHVEGMSDMLKVCMSSLARHDAGHEFKVWVLSDASSWCSGNEAQRTIHDYEWAEVHEYEIGMTTTASSMHARLLDMAVEEIETEHILTLDSDCFPVASGWLGELVAESRGSNILPGIVWPWKPIGDEPVKEIERRIRSHHNWDCTQVACQLAPVAFIKDNWLAYESGDDTGFALTDKAHELGMTTKGWMPTRCAVPDFDGYDSEMNREKCLMFADKVFHMGGASRQSQGASIDPQGIFNGPQERVFSEGGAEWLLRDGGYEYAFDREDEVAESKMRRMYANMVQYLQTSDRLFDPDLSE